jgi:hypothetical protein
MSLGSVTILEDHSTDRRSVLRKAFDHLHFEVALVVRSNKTADESDDNDRRGSEPTGRRSPGLSVRRGRT